MAFILLPTSKTKTKPKNSILKPRQGGLWGSVGVPSLRGVGLCFEALETKRLTALLPRWVGLPSPAVSPYTLSKDVLLWTRPSLQVTEEAPKSLPLEAPSPPPECVFIPEMAPPPPPQHKHLVAASVGGPSWPGPPPASRPTAAQTSRVPASLRN